MLSVKPWQPLAVGCYCCALVGCLCAGGVLTLGLQALGVAGFRELDDFGNVLVGTLSLQGMACVLGLVFLWWHGMGWREVVGLRDPRLKRSLRLTALVFLIALPAIWLVQTASVSLLTRLGHPPADQTAVRWLETATSWWVRGYLGGFAVLLAPVAEEFVFRGLLYPFVKQLGWPKLAWFGVNGLFALIHYDLATFLPLLLLALILTWLYEQTDNLLAPITLHALFNAANIGMLILNQRRGVSPSA